MIVQHLSCESQEGHSHRDDPDQDDHQNVLTMDTRRYRPFSGPNIANSNLIWARPRRIANRQDPVSRNRPAFATFFGRLKLLNKCSFDLH